LAAEGQLRLKKAMELYERRYVKSEDLQGMDLSFGNSLNYLFTFSFSKHF